MTDIQIVLMDNNVVIYNIANDEAIGDTEYHYSSPDFPTSDLVMDDDHSTVVVSFSFGRQAFLNFSMRYKASRMVMLREAFVRYRTIAESIGGELVLNITM